MTYFRKYGIINMIIIIGILSILLIWLLYSCNYWYTKYKALIVELNKWVYAYNTLANLWNLGLELDVYTESEYLTNNMNGDLNE